MNADFSPSQFALPLLMQPMPTAMATTAATSATTTATTTASKDLTLEEKQRLAQTINDMQVSSLLGVVNILMKHLPDLKDQAGNELKIDLDGLESDVLRELEAYCKTDSAQAKALGHSTGGHSDGPTPKKAKTERAPDSADKSDKAEKERLLKMHVLAGCERLLRDHGQPLSAYELLVQGTDAGHFHFTGNTMPDKQLSNILSADIKSGKRVFEHAQGGKYGLTEFSLTNEEKATHVAQRNAFLATLPPFATPATAGERELLRAKYVHQGLWQNKNVWIFDKPVDAAALGLHDYHNIISEPMDLGTIKQRLAEGYYKSGAEYKRDVMLVWANAMKYNPPADPVHIMALEYQQQTQQLLKEYGLGDN